MVDTKRWWESKTIWSSLIGALFALLALFDLLPADLDQEEVVAAVLTVTSLAAAIFRKSATTEIVPANKT